MLMNSANWCLEVRERTRQDACYVPVALLGLRRGNLV